MKLHRFFVNIPIDNSDIFSISDKELIHQIKDVLRLKVGDSIVVLDGSGLEYAGEIELVAKSGVNIRIAHPGRPATSTWQVEVTLCSSMIKKDKYEWVLQKCTELGVSKFQPIISERTEKQKLNKERAEKIIKEAAEQSGRNDLPELKEIKELEEFLKENKENVFALHMDGESFNKKDLISKQNINLLIGPEGGWGEKDMELFNQYNIPLISLGAQVLRAETASIAASSLLLLG